MNILERRSGVVTHLADSEYFYLVVCIPGDQGKAMVFQAKGNELWSHIQDVDNNLSPPDAVEHAKKASKGIN